MSPMTGRARQIANRLLVVVACLWPTISLAQTTVKYVHTDALGSVVAMTDASGTVVEATREYEPYGQQLSPAMQDGPGYTGHVQDAATGLTYMQQRYYDPSIGRFLSVDPVTAYGSGDWRQLNRYAYAFNNPYKFTDPDGRQSCPTGTRICMSERTLQRRLDGINAVTSKYSFGNERTATKYFSNVANPLSRQSGKEIGANLEQRSEKDLRVVDFHFDKGPQGRNGVSTLPYAGGFTWKGIMHTHPGTRGFSGLGVYGQSGKYYGLYTSSDAQQAVDFGVNNYLSKADGTLHKLDFEAMRRDVRRNVGNDKKVYADDYDQEL